MKRIASRLPEFFLKHLLPLSEADSITLLRADRMTGNRLPFVDIPPEVINLFPPSQDALLNLTRQRITTTQLRIISHANYGIVADEVASLLQEIAGRGVFPTHIPFVLQEVFELTVLSEIHPPDGQTTSQIGSEIAGFESLLFVCAAIMFAEADSRILFDDRISDSTLARALVSASSLDRHAQHALGQFLTWRTSNHPTCDPHLTAVGILSLTLLETLCVSPKIQSVVADWVLRVEDQYEREFRPWPGTEPPPVPFSIQQGFWRPIAEEFETASKNSSSNELSEKILLCSSLIC